jgi:hypothetical protein
MGFVAMLRHDTISWNQWLRFTSVGTIATLALVALPVSTIAQPNSLQVSTSTTNPPPLLEPDRSPVAVILPVGGKVNVRLINQTYTAIAYNELSGSLEPQTLAGRSTATLTGLTTPVNLNFYRPDRGFLIVTLQPSLSVANTLDLTLTETADQGLGKTSLVVNPDGTVYLF